MIDEMGLVARLRQSAELFEAVRAMHAGAEGADAEPHWSSQGEAETAHDLASEAAAAIERLVAERDEAREIVRDIHWMAVRYADGRKSYAPGMCNDAIRKGYDGGWLTYSEFRQHDLDPQYAREGDKPEYQQIEARAAAAEAMLEVSTFTPWLREWCRRHFGKWITHNTAKGALNELRARQALGDT